MNSGETGFLIAVLAIIGWFLIILLGHKVILPYFTNTEYELNKCLTETQGIKE